MGGVVSSLPDGGIACAKVGGMDHEQFQLLSYGGRDRGQKVKGLSQGASKTGPWHLSQLDGLNSLQVMVTEQVVGRGPSWG